MSAATTDAPSAAKRRALARPMPDPAPVTMATFPDSSIRASSRTAGPTSSVRGRDAGRVPAARWGLPAMLSAYRVIDATDHRGQLAGMILAGLGAEVVLAEPPGGQPAPPARRRPRVLGLQPGQAERRVRDRRRRARARARRRRAARQRRPLRPDVVAAVNPAVVHVTVSAFGRDGPKADWAASDLTILAAGCSQALNGDSDRAPVRTSVPQAWLHAGAEAAVGALLALTERADERARPARRRVGPAGRAAGRRSPACCWRPTTTRRPSARRAGSSPGPIHLQFVYPALRRLRLDHAAVRHDDRPVHARA